MTRVIAEDSVLLNYPADYVYRTLTDFASYSQWWPKKIKFRIVHLNPGVTGTTLEIQNTPLVKWKAVISGFKQSRLLAIDYTGGAWVGRTIWRFEDGEGKSKLTLDIDLEVNKGWLRVLSKFMNFSRVHSKEIKEVFKNLNIYLKNNKEPVDTAELWHQN